MSLGVRTAEEEALDALAFGAHDDPFAVLGRHVSTHGGRRALVFRTIQPSADRVELITPRGAVSMERRRPEGVFEAVIPSRRANPRSWRTDFVCTMGITSARFIRPVSFGRC
jgi:1,4-alpha-glucan branching enzyme